jgi:hypothetical protein
MQDRLFDMRMSSGVAASYVDPLDSSSAIYSLTSIGRERFIAGSARYAMLKFFDFRITGARTYQHINGLGCSSEEPHPTSTTQKRNNSMSNNTLPHCIHASLIPQRCRYHDAMQKSFYRPNFDVYLPRYRNRNVGAESPVFALKSVSPFSPVIYAGTSGTLTELNLTSVADTTYDPYFGDTVIRPYVPDPTANEFCPGQSYSKRTAHVPNERRPGDICLKWDPKGANLRLKMAETDDGTSDPNATSSIVPVLRTQCEMRAVDHLVKKTSREDRQRHRLDERWQAVESPFHH